MIAVLMALSLPLVEIHMFGLVRPAEMTDSDHRIEAILVSAIAVPFTSHRPMRAAISCGQQVAQRCLAHSIKGRHGSSGKCFRELGRSQVLLPILMISRRSMYARREGSIF